MTDNAYIVKGSFDMGRKTAQSFSKELIAKDEKDAIERVCSIMGSKHGVERRFLKIEKVERLAPDKVTDLVVKGQLPGKEK